MVMSKAIKATGAAMASIALTLSMAPMAFAEDMNVIPNEDGNYLATSTLTIEAAVTPMDITVPTEYKMLWNAEDGLVMPSPEAFTITNNTAYPIRLSHMLNPQISDESGECIARFEVKTTDGYYSTPLNRGESVGLKFEPTIVNTHRLITNGAATYSTGIELEFDWE